MGDELENPNADEPIAAPPDAPQDPVHAAQDDAWLAQFRADNAAKVMEYDFTAAGETQAEGRAEGARRDYDLKQVDSLTKMAAEQRAEATADEKKAKEDAARHDEWEVKADMATHFADASDSMAGHFRADAAEADAAKKRLDAEVKEEYAIYEQAQKDYKIMQEQAVAAQRIATDEAKLPHPGDPAPVQDGEPPAR